MAKSFFIVNNYEQKKSRRFKIFSVVMMLILTGIIAFLVYFNYDYMVLKFLVAENYIYTESLDNMYEYYTGEKPGEKGNYMKTFDYAVIGAFTEKVREFASDPYTYLYTPPQYIIQQETTKAVALEVAIEEKTSDTVYLRIPNVSEYTRDYIFDNKEKLKPYKNIIIDLQSNHGGALDALYDISDLFLDKGAVIGYETARHSFFSKKITDKKPKFFEFEKIVILQNGETASAAEGFIMSLKENLGNVYLIGTKTFGKGIGQVTLPLKYGYAVKATVLRIETPKQNSINKIGIEPDVKYEGDKIMDFALEQLGKN